MMNVMNQSDAYILVTNSLATPASQPSLHIAHHLSQRCILLDAGIDTSLKKRRVMSRDERFVQR